MTLAVLSAVLYILSFPNFNQAWLAWISLVPLSLIAHAFHASPGLSSGAGCRGHRRTAAFSRGSSLPFRPLIFPFFWPVFASASRLYLGLYWGLGLVYRQARSEYEAHLTGTLLSVARDVFGGGGMGGAGISAYVPLLRISVGAPGGFAGENPAAHSDRFYHRCLWGFVSDRSGSISQLPHGIPKPIVAGSSGVLDR